MDPHCRLIMLNRLVALFFSGGTAFCDDLDVSRAFANEVQSVPFC